jgi:hypothetical protein
MWQPGKPVSIKTNTMATRIYPCPGYYDLLTEYAEQRII